jgi:hypothetical protein
MKNLAGVKTCDVYIRDELTAAGIELVDNDRRQHEVPSTVSGRLGHITFDRAQYYWVATGRVPYELARKLYHDSGDLARRDIRVGGHCGCPAPEVYGTDYYDTAGKEIVVDEDGHQEKWFREHMPDKASEYHFVRSKVERKALTANAFVDCYHIDSQEGLNLFAKVIQESAASKDSGDGR